MTLGILTLILGHLWETFTNYLNRFIQQRTESSFYSLQCLKVCCPSSSWLLNPCFFSLCSFTLLFELGSSCSHAKRVGTVNYQDWLRKTCGFFSFVSTSASSPWSRPRGANLSRCLLCATLVCLKMRIEKGQCF